jgi:dipeptidyl aminopeptidase/acylaminoacyl peptidase
MIGVLVGIAIVLAAAAAAFTAIRLLLFPWLPRDLGGAPNLDAQARHVRIPVGAADALDGWYLAGRRTEAVLILHGFGRDHHRAWRYGAFLQEAGYGVLAIDFRSSRAFGRGRRFPTTLGHHELPDAEAAFDWLAAQPGVGSMGILGESLGASVALMVAARRTGVRAVVADGAFAHSAAAIEDSTERWARMPRQPVATMARSLGRAVTGIDPGTTDTLASVRMLKRLPIFFIHGLKDDRLSHYHVEQLWEAAGAKDEQWIVPKSGHNEAWRDHRDEYQRRVLAFFERHLVGSDQGSGDGPTALAYDASASAIQPG